jgi:hypothetical protein
MSEDGRGAWESAAWTTAGRSVEARGSAVEVPYSVDSRFES